MAAATAAAAGGGSGGSGGSGGAGGSSGTSSVWRHLAEVTSELTVGRDPEVAATLIHLMLGPNAFFLTLKVEGAAPPPAPDDDFWTLFDLTEETALEHAEDMNYKVCASLSPAIFLLPPINTNVPSHSHSHSHHSTTHALLPHPYSFFLFPPAPLTLSKHEYSVFFREPVRSNSRYHFPIITLLPNMRTLKRRRNFFPLSSPPHLPTLFLRPVHPPVMNDL